MKLLLLSMVVGALIGIIDVVPMLMKKLGMRKILMAFTHYLLITVIIFHIQLPVIWWLEGLVVTLPMTIPVLISVIGTPEKKAIPFIAAMAVCLGILIALAKHLLIPLIS